MTGVVTVLGYEIGAVPAGLALAVFGGATIFALKALISWLYGVAISLALRHAIWATIGATGISIQTFVDGGLREFVPSAFRWVVDLVGVDLPFLAAVSVGRVVGLA